jgi:hypothetical protein
MGQGPINPTHCSWQTSSHLIQTECRSDQAMDMLPTLCIIGSPRCIATLNGRYWHNGRMEIPRVPRASPSAKYRALGEEMHSGKRVFPECLIVHGTRGREALGEDPLPRVYFFSTRGSQPLPRVPHPSTRGRIFLFFVFFCLIFF